MKTKGDVVVKVPGQDGKLVSKAEGKKRVKWQPHISDRVAALSRRAGAVRMGIQGMIWAAEAGICLEEADLRPVRELSDELEDALAALALELAKRQSDGGAARERG
jgi:hypothetical protein